MEASTVKACNLAIDRGVAIARLIEDLDPETQNAAMGIAGSLNHLSYMKNYEANNRSAGALQASKQLPK